MFLRAWGYASVLVAMGVLGGCASPAMTTWEPSNPWLDREFAFAPGLVDASESELFALDPELLAALRSPKMQRASADHRIQYLVDTLVDNKQIPFIYAAGHSTGAAETWRNRSGDCLSLTVLAYAMAQELKLLVSMQEINGTVVFDRRGSIDYRVGHVNVFVHRHMPNETAIATSLNRGVVIDFEPSYGASRSGKSLSRQSILARYYNNLGAEYLANGNSTKAYAYFKAAMQTDPGFTAAATNMAWLYWHKGYAKATEGVLVMAVAANSESDTAVRGLHRLLMAQGRTQEAQHYQALLEAREKQQPYYWIDQGLDQLQARNYRRAIESLERAQALTTGFSEVHRYLAVAYLQDGKPDKAQEQLTTLEQIDSHDPALAAINRKIMASRKTSL
ncbi:MAG: hypothetical protein CFE43_02580 [Burkholderiales bacterium PBB3]|nr:MAG: hypothetical protein CFE43_02580 [Burkholderiales bacterium PBB3]